MERYSKSSEINWHNLTNQFWWTLNMDEVFLGDESIGAKGTQVIIDSGTSFLLMPTSNKYCS